MKANPKRRRTKIVGWVNVYRGTCGETILGNFIGCEKRARELGVSPGFLAYITTIPIRLTASECKKAGIK